MNQMKFIKTRRQPVGLFVGMTLAPNGQRQSSPILNAYIAKGMPMIVMAKARLPVK